MFKNYTFLLIIKHKFTKNEHIRISYSKANSKFILGVRLWTIKDELRAISADVFAIRNLVHESRQEMCINYLNSYMVKSVSTIWISPCDSLGNFFFKQATLVY